MWWSETLATTASNSVSAWKLLECDSLEDRAFGRVRVDRGDLEAPVGESTEQARRRRSRSRARAQAVAERASSANSQNACARFVIGRLDPTNRYSAATSGVR